MAEQIVYRIDGKDRIDFFNPEFLSVARTNGMPDPSTYFGTSIWDYLTDDLVIENYRTAYDRVRSTHANFNLVFRSDSPDCRRSVQMELRWLNNDGIEHACRVALEEKRPPLLLFDPKVKRSLSFAKLCSWCGQVQVFPKWVEPEEANRMLAGSPGQPLPELTHGLCPVCADRYAAQRKLAA